MNITMYEAFRPYVTRAVQLRIFQEVSGLLKKVSKKRFGQILVENGIITDDQLKGLLRKQKTSRKRLGEMLVEESFCSENEIASILASQLGLRLLNLKITPVEPEAIQIIPEKVARKHHIIPISVDDGQIHVAVSDPLRYEAIEDSRFASSMKVVPYVATSSDIEWAIEQHYNLGESLDSIVRDIAPSSDVEVIQEVGPDLSEVEDLKQKSKAAPIIRMVNYFISMAADNGASDIHVEPEIDRLVIRNRIDGLLREEMDLPKWVQGAIVSRIKIMAKMDIAEKRRPQDGKISVKIASRTIDLRVSTLPAIYGEKVVIRVLDPQKVIFSLDQIGLGNKDQTRFLSLISKPQGIILVTGPTGSGKTTTLYASLTRIRNPEINIITIEDPIEYELKGITQVQINEKVGVSFSNTLRSVLRQDPDVIMVGEMRDYETAAIAMQSALTGHLVLSTVHTNDSLSTITRLRNLGIPNYLIASTINGVVTQRLVRIICPYCKTVDDPEEKNLLRLGIAANAKKDIKFFRGRGCDSCAGTGFRGRTAIYEILLFTNRIKDLVNYGASESSMRHVALAEGMETLAQAGLRKVVKGETSLQEVVRVNQMSSEFESACEQCGYQITPDFIACPQCGKHISKNCPNCRKIVNPGWQFCPYCSYSFSKESEQ